VAQQEQLAAQLLAQQQQQQMGMDDSSQQARLSKLEQLIRQQEGLLAHLEQEQQPSLTEQRLTELEAASAKQAEILANLGEAVDDVNIESATTASQLTVLETIASQQKKGGQFFMLFSIYFHLDFKLNIIQKYRQSSAGVE